MLKTVLALIALVALTGFALAQLVLGCLGLIRMLGVGGAVLGVLLWLVLGFRLPLQLGTLVGAVTLWHWPWLPALLFAAPREVLKVPGWVSRLIAAVRHPPPSWRGVTSVGR